MKKHQLIVWSFVDAVAALLYIAAVAWLMSNAEHLFGKITSFWGPLAFLLLFVLSATIVGLLVLGRPIHLYLNDMKREAWRVLFFTVGWLILAAIVVFLSLALA
jgi:hypothetical protein